MTASLHEAFQYSAWATNTLIAVCRALPIEHLRRPARGFGSVLAMLNHIVLSDAGYVAALTGSGPRWVADRDEADDLDQLQARVEATARLWEHVLGEQIDAERVLLLDNGAYACKAAVVVV